MCIDSLPIRIGRGDAKAGRAPAFLVFEAWLSLLYVDLVVHVGGLRDVHRLVRNRAARSQQFHNPESLCRSVDLACVFYFKRVLCLQRSAATAILLRRCGWNAAMIIGVQMLPFRSHAWVELEGAVVNDRPYMREIYQILDRC